MHQFSIGFRFQSVSLSPVQPSRRSSTAWIVSATCLLLAAIVGCFFWPTASYDITNVHPALRELAAPYRSVRTGAYADGGSIYFRIVDRDGRELLMALPVDADGGKRKFERLFVGATHITKDGATEVTFSKDTRWMLLSIIEQYGTPPFNYDALCDLRGHPRDYAQRAGFALGSLLNRKLK